MIARFATDFADEAVLLPLAAGIGLLFLALGARRCAVSWLLAVGGTMAATLLLKLLGAACGPCWPDVLPRSTSGHTAAGTAIYGGLLAASLGRRRLAALAPPAVAALIGATRLALGVHTAPEVVVGAALGIAGACAFARFAGPLPPLRRAWPALPLGLLALALLHGHRLPAEAVIHRAGLDWLPVCGQCRLLAP